jgi:predicted transposase YbfD/YdcC
VSSLDARAVSPERFLELTCGHWQVENRLHLIKDRWWDEDKHALFRPGLGEIGSAMTDLAVSLLGSWGEKGKTITKRAMAVARQPMDYLKIFRL